MRKVLFNKWFLLTALLTISLSAFSIATYKKVRQVCAPDDCTQTTTPRVDKGEMLIDISRQFTSYVSAP